MVKSLLWFFPVSFILCACPFESKVPLAAKPVEPVDSTLLGYWYGIVKDGSDFFGIEALDITQQSDSTYNIIRYGKAAKGDMILPDTSYFTGYISYIGEQRFMNVEGSVVIVETRRKKPPLVVTQKVFYVASFETRHDTLSMKTITENFPGAPRSGFNTSEEFKETVISVTGQQKNIYDDLYSLSYRKIPKPQPLKAF
jgi:hypothetical protein